MVSTTTSSFRRFFQRRHAACFLFFRLANSWTPPSSAPSCLLCSLPLLLCRSCYAAPELLCSLPLLFVRTAPVVLSFGQMGNNRKIQEICYRSLEKVDSRDLVDLDENTIPNLFQEFFLHIFR